jgi:ATP-dependent protease Clp ATPase subunit
MARPDLLVFPAGSCSFCHQAASPALQLVGMVGRDVRVCAECVALCQEIVAENPRPEGWSPPPRTGEREFACSFCDTPHSQVHKLIAGPWIYICDACAVDASGLL